MNIEYTRLAETDGERLRELNKLFASVFDDRENYVDSPPSDEYLTTLLKDRNTIVLVAVSDGRVVGGLVAYTLTKFEQERKEIYLYDLAVSTNYQHRGIGKALVNALRQTAKSIGAYVVFVQADEGDEAIGFYESLGPSENLRTRNFDFNS